MANGMFQRRSDFDIKASILKSVKYGLKNKRSRTGTSYELFKRHTEESIAAGLLEKNGHGLEITEKGETFLEIYEGELVPLISRPENQNLGVPDYMLSPVPTY